MTRVQINSQQIKYDARHDVLHVYFNPSDLSVDDEEFPGIVIRRSAKDDDKINGLVILDYTKRYSDLKRVLPDFDFSNLNIIN